MDKKITNCEMCGQKVSLYSTDEGTNSYTPESEIIAEDMYDFINNIAGAWLPEGFRGSRHKLLKKYKEEHGS